MYIKQGGATSQTIEVFIQDSSKTDGSGLTGLVYNSGSLVASYVRPTAARAAITLATQTTTGAWSSGGFVEIDSTNMPGWYRLDVPDAAIAANVDHVGIELKGATNMAPCNVLIVLTSVNLQDAVRGGMTALPNANAAAANGLLTFGTSTGQLSPVGGKVTTTYTIVKNTAFNNFMFKMVLSSDHVSPATGKTVTAQRSLDGAAYGACANSVTELSNGTYILNLAAADLNANCVALRFTASGCDATDVIIITQT